VDGLALLEQSRGIEGAIVTEDGDVRTTEGMRFLSDLPGSAWRGCLYA